jgi:transcriptional regulator with XRE-family HTH domain
MGDRLSQEEFGRIVAVHMDREKALTGATISRWESGEALPDLPTLRAIASLVDFDPGWLAFGSSTEARGPTERRLAENQAKRDARERERTTTRAATEALINRAAAESHALHERLTNELREKLGVDTPEARRRCREIVREMDGPTPLDILARTLFMSEEEAEHAREQDRERERRYEEEDVEESEEDA